MTLTSPYAAPGFYDAALAKGRHRDIVGGRWEETGNIVLPVLINHGLQYSTEFLDIGAGSLRIGCKVIPFVGPGQYWATDASGALMRRGYEVELNDATRARQPLSNLIEDAAFALPDVPDTITMALAFAVFTHLPMNHLRRALINIHARLPNLQKLLFTVFLAPDPAAYCGPFRQADGVVTHPDKTPWHMLASDVLHMARDSGFVATMHPDRLPRGQILFSATRA